MHHGLDSALLIRVSTLYGVLNSKESHYGAQLKKNKAGSSVFPTVACPGLNRQKQAQDHFGYWYHWIWVNSRVIDVLAPWQTWTLPILMYFTFLPWLVHTSIVPDLSTQESGTQHSRVPARYKRSLLEILVQSMNVLTIRWNFEGTSTTVEPLVMDMFNFKKRCGLFAEASRDVLWVDLLVIRCSAITPDKYE